MSSTSLQVHTGNRQILKIALPIALALLVPQINFLANTLFLSRLGETELGAAGLTGVYYLVFALVGSGINSGLQSVMARRAGENRSDEIGKLFNQAFWIITFFSVAIIIFSYLFSSYFLKNLIKNIDVEEDTIHFIQIRIWGLPFLYFFQVCNALLVSTNQSQYMKYSFAIQAGTNILLDYVLIFGKWGFPHLGFNGGAIASVLSEIIGAGVALYILFKKELVKRFRLFSNMRFQFEYFKLVFVQSLPLVFQYGLSVGAWFVFYILIEHYGERELAISNAMRNIFSLFGIFIWAFASTSNAMVSNIIGQGRPKEVPKLITRIATLSFMFTCCMCIVANLLPSLFLSMYDQSPAFVQQAIPVLRIVTFALLMMSIATTWLNAITGTGNTTMNLLFEFVSISIYGVYIYYVLYVKKLSLSWAWASELVYWFIILVLSYFYIKLGNWERKKI